MRQYAAKIKRPGEGWKWLREELVEDVLMFAQMRDIKHHIQSIFYDRDLVEVIAVPIDFPKIADAQGRKIT